MLKGERRWPKCCHQRVFRHRVERRVARIGYTPDGGAIR